LTCGNGWRRRRKKSMTQSRNDLTTVPNPECLREFGNTEGFSVNSKLRKWSCYLLNSLLYLDLYKLMRKVCVARPPVFFHLSFIIILALCRLFLLQYV
jgi:hypothetical protein